MGKVDRERLQTLLEMLCPNVYFQPPANLHMEYPCIVYNKGVPRTMHANNSMYSLDRSYELQVIDADADTEIATNILTRFSMCEIVAEFTKDGLYHTSLNLYF